MEGVGAGGSGRGGTIIVIHVRGGGEAAVHCAAISCQPTGG